MGNRSHADVRKAVVFAIVDMYRVLGVPTPEQKPAEIFFRWTAIT